jgi:Dynamin family
MKSDQVLSLSILYIMFRIRNVLRVGSRIGRVAPNMLKQTGTSSSYAASAYIASTSIAATRVRPGTNQMLYSSSAAQSESKLESNPRNEKSDRDRWISSISSVLSGGQKPTPSKMLEIYSGAVRDSMIDCDLPTIVVTGDQNGGKSSLLENILRRSFLPTGEGEVSRKLINIRTYPSDESYVMINGEKFADDARIARKIEELNLYTPSDTIEVDAYGPDLRLGNYCDTPGLKYGDRADTYMDMVTKALTAPNAIPLVVASATRDLATIQAIELCRRLDVLGYAIGAFTKMDILPTDTVGLERAFKGDNPDLHLARGWHGVIALTDRDRIKGATYGDKRKEERSFFNSHPQFQGGTEKLIGTCEAVIVREMIEQIPVINTGLDRQRREAEQRLETMEILLNDSDTQVIGDVEHTLKKFLGSGSGLIEYNIHQHLHPVFGPMFDEIRDQYRDIRPEFSKFQTDYSILKLLEQKRVDDTVLKAERNFEYMFRFGEGQPVLKRSEETMERAASIDTARSLAADMIHFTIQDTYDDSGQFIDHPAIWHAKYGNDITRVANSMDIVGGVTEAVIKAMNQTLDQLDYGSRDSQITISSLLRGFTEESVRLNMKAYVDVFFRHMIETKRRVVIDPRDFPKHLSGHPNFAEAFDFKRQNIFNRMIHPRNQFKLDVGVMSPVFSYVVVSESQERVLKELSSSIGTQVIGKIAHDLLVSVFAMNDKTELRKNIGIEQDSVALLSDLIKVNDKFKVLHPDAPQVDDGVIRHAEHGA